eukprot:6544222-Prymnesium_polylepis.1
MALPCRPPRTWTGWTRLAKRQRRRRRREADPDGGRSRSESPLIWRRNPLWLAITSTWGLLRG